jgi:hypothetical protein
MSNPTDEKDTSHAAVQDEPHSPLTAQPSRGIDKQNTDPKDGQPEVAEYKADWLESLPNYEKGLIVSAIIIALLYVSFWSKWITDKPTEFFITSLLGFAVFLAVIVQAYVAKRQWHAMHEQRDLMKASMKLTENMFYVSERAYLCIDEITPQEKPINPEGSIRFALKLFNGGRTPAFNVRVRSFQCSTHIFDAEAIPDIIMEKGGNGLKNAKNRSVGRMILAGKDVTIWHNPDQNLSTTERAEWMAKRNRYVFIPIELSYKDIHRDTHSLIYWYQLFEFGFALRKPAVLKVSKYKNRSNKDKKAN